MLISAAAKFLQSLLTLCNPTDGSPPGSPVPGMPQARTHFLFQCMKVKSESEATQSCLTVSDSMDCSLPGFSFYGVFQARVLGWVAIAFLCEFLLLSKMIQLYTYVFSYSFPLWFITGY